MWFCINVYCAIIVVFTNYLNQGPKRCFFFVNGLEDPLGCPLPFGRQRRFVGFLQTENHPVVLLFANRWGSEKYNFILSPSPTGIDPRRALSSIVTLTFGRSTLEVYKEQCAASRSYPVW